MTGGRGPGETRRPFSRQPPLPTGFANPQLKKLVGQLDPGHVRSKEVEGRRLDYIEGWFAIAEANRIFGYAGWDREMVQFEKAFERKEGTLFGWGYLARVRITVRAGTTQITREGTGYGQAWARTLGDAQERALKTAETDATKRALATFGNRFGLGLYDKERSAPGAIALGKATAETPPQSRAAPRAQTQSGFILLGAEGETLASSLSAEGFCTGLRQLIEAARDIGELDGMMRHNQAGLVLLRQRAPALTSRQGEHYADIAERLAAKRRAKLGGGVPPMATLAAPEPVADVTAPGAGTAATGQTTTKDAPAVTAAATDRPVDAAQAGSDAESTPAMTHAGSPDADPAPDNTDDVEIATGAAVQPADAGRDGTERNGVAGRMHLRNGNASRLASGVAIDKSLLAVATTRRLRNKAHLLFVASKPCLICGELACHAHHITYAQPRGLSVKVSDEFTVPLCPLHHNQCHAQGNERAFWRSHRIEPLRAALALWLETIRQQQEPEH